MSKFALKQRKQKHRERDNKRRKIFDRERRLHQERRRRYQSLYPEFRYDAGTADPEFVQAVKKAVGTINFEDKAVFPGWEIKLYRLLKQEGSWELGRFLRSLRLESSTDGQMAELHFAFNLGQTVMNRIPERIRERHLPMSDMRFVPKGNFIQVICRSLCRAKGSGGTVYYSRRKPTLDIDGEAKIVAFSKHAIDQTTKRIKPNSNSSYGALGDIFAFFDQCSYFEQVELHHGQLGFTFYDKCCPRSVTQWYVDEVLDTDKLAPKLGRPHYRVGYCPAVVEGDFVKAKTLLLPGYTNTPEYTAILKCSRTRTEREELIARAKDWDNATLYESQDFSLLKWFHEHGVPQVVHLHGKVYDGVRY